MCKVMNELRDGENIARKLSRASADVDLQTMYAQWALDAERTQRLHWDHCYECQRGPERCRA